MHIRFADYHESTLVCAKIENSRSIVHSIARWPYFKKTTNQKENPSKQKPPNIPKQKQNRKK